MRPKAIFFDVMDTLVKDPIHEVMPGFFGMTLDELREARHPTAWVDFELGMMDERGFLDLFLGDREWDREGFCRHVRASYRWLPGMEELLRELRARGEFTLWALSNYPIWYQWVEECCGLSRFLDGAFISYEMGVRKPDARSFLDPCREAGVLPEEALFVDDRAVNCEAARAVGVRSILFTDAESLRRELAHCGVQLLLV